MAQQFWIKLTRAERGHLLNLIENNDLDVIYYGPPDQYWKRSDRLKNKLRIAQEATNIKTITKR